MELVGLVASSVGKYALHGHTYHRCHESHVRLERYALPRMVMSDKDFAESLAILGESRVQSE